MEEEEVVLDEETEEAMVQESAHTVAKMTILSTHFIRNMVFHWVLSSNKEQ